MSPPSSDSSTPGKSEEETWENGNKYVPFVTLMGLRKLDEWTFQSAYPAYSPGGFTRAYGGHVYAQSALAAARTVRPGFVIHVNVPPFLLSWANMLILWWVEYHWAFSTSGRDGFAFFV
jgi:hypothetical protein